MAIRPSVLVTTRVPGSVLDTLRECADVDAHSGPDDLPRTELLRRVAGKAALMPVLTNRIDGELLDAAGAELRIVANIAVGHDNVDLSAAAERGVTVTNTPDVLTESVADFTMALVLAVTRRLVEGDRLVRAGGWKGWALDFMLGSEQSGKQLGIVGFGRIGQAVARRAAAFGMAIAYADRRDWGDGGIAGARRLSFDELLVSSDVVSIHVPLGPDTRRLFDQRALARMKRSAYLVNTSRGAVVDEAALVWALSEHLIAGAALDVFEREPHVHPGLLAFDNVVLAPHLGSATRETRTAMARLAARNIVEVLAGRPPLTPVRAVAAGG